MVIVDIPRRLVDGRDLGFLRMRVTASVLARREQED